MSAREEVLGRIRTALRESPSSPPVHRGYRRAQPTSPSLDLLVERIEDYRARVLRTETDDVPAVLGQLAHDAVVVPDGFPEEWLVDLRAAIYRDDPPLAPRTLDQIPTALTTCTLAIAETGTIVLDAGPGQGRRALSLVPDHLVVVVRAEDVVTGVPEAVARLDPRRPQTWISGPSATSDIELDRVEGVHGPRRLDVVLVS